MGDIEQKVLLNVALIRFRVARGYMYEWSSRQSRPLVAKRACFLCRVEGEDRRQG